MIEYSNTEKAKRINRKTANEQVVEQNDKEIYIAENNPPQQRYGPITSYKGYGLRVVFVGG